MHPTPQHALERPCAAGFSRDGALVICVVATHARPTRAALALAAQLSHGLDATVRLLVPHVVPYPLSLDRPGVCADPIAQAWAEGARAIALPTTVELLFCRDAHDAVATALAPASLVVIGQRRLWFGLAETRLARELRRRGHGVVMAGGHNARLRLHPCYVALLRRLLGLNAVLRKALAAVKGTTSWTTSSPA